MTYIIGIIIVCITVALMFLLRMKSKTSPARSIKKSKRLQVKETRLSKAERLEMLDNVVNLASNDPEKTAGIVRQWMNDEKRAR
ncbi:MAG: hypothetical protein HY042_02580 [Spirochaetia bacterium]|nr:hypothetical protein [Spirochaetia bacterium]